MTFTLTSEKDLWYPLEQHSAAGGWEQKNANVHAWDCLGMGLEWTQATPPRRKPRRPKTTAQHLAPEWQTWKQNYCYHLYGEMYPWMFFANITGGKSATIIVLLMLLFNKIFFRRSCTSSMKIFRVMLKKEMPITIPFLYSMQTSVQTLCTCTSMNTSYQFFDLITTIVSNN